MSELARSTWSEMDSAERSVLIWPLGATEQHGPHLPLATDTILAEHVAAAVQRQRPGAALAPAMPWGASGEHADFPGTISIGTDAVASLVVEMIRDACRWWSGVLIINGHGGNQDGIADALQTCRHEGRAVVVVHLALPGMDAHAGNSETSLMLHLQPDLVRQARSAVGATDPMTVLLPRLRRDGVRAISPTGVLGDPTLATAEQGAQLFSQLVVKAVSAYDALDTDIRSRT